MKCKGLVKFLFVSVGGLMLLMLLGVVSSVMLDYKPEEIKEINLIEEWELYRVFFYISLILLWVPICKYITKPKAVIDEEQSDEEKKNAAELREKQKKDFEYLKSSWWKLALLLIFFELVIVQQLGL